MQGALDCDLKFNFICKFVFLYAIVLCYIDMGKDRQVTLRYIIPHFKLSYILYFQCEFNVIKQMIILYFSDDNVEHFQTDRPESTLSHC